MHIIIYMYIYRYTEPKLRLRSLARYLFAANYAVCCMAGQPALRAMRWDLSVYLCPQHTPTISGVKMIN